MKHRLYPKLLAGYILYGLIGFIIIATFTYHLMYDFIEKREASSLYRESAQISSSYAANYFSRSMTLEEIQTQLKTLSSYLSAEIWIVDPKGTIILNTSDSNRSESEVFRIIVPLGSTIQISAER